MAARALRVACQLLLTGAAVCVVACSTLEPISPERKVRGIRATQAAVVVPTPIVGRSDDTRIDVQSTVCTPVVADKEGVYFKSREPVILNCWVLVTPRLITGGIYVPDDAAKPCKPFYIHNGMPCRTKKTDRPTKVILVDCVTQKEIPVAVQ